MNIARLQYEPKFQALEIYLSGCKTPHCPGCHNDSLWNFNVGEDWTSWEERLKRSINTTIVKNVFIMGGCPLNQDIYELEAFLIFLSLFKKSITLWTRYQLEDIPENILQWCDYVKTGFYDCNSESYVEPVLGVRLASLNQRIIKVKNV